MQIHELKVNKKKSRKRIGRGGKRGTYAGRGMKGQKARTGAKVDPLFEGGHTTLIERLKKVRGFKSVNPKKLNFNLAILERKFQDGETVSRETLFQKKLIKGKDKRRGIKILGAGEITKKLIIEKEIFMSASAREKLEKAGGKVISNKEIKEK